MAVAVTGKNYTQISNCESATGWTGNSAALDPATFKEGSNSLSFILRTSGNNDVYYTGSWNLTGKHLRLWFLTTVGGLMQTLAANGVQFFLYDGTNTAYWTMLGRDTYPGGWFNLVLDLAKAPASGTVNLTAVTRIGFRLILTGAGKQAANTWIDNLCVCDGLIASGDLSGSYFSFEDIFAADDAAAGGWGVIRKIGGVYFLAGSIDIGASIATKFQAQNQTVVFEDRPVSSTLYAINVVDDANASHTTEFILGSKSGTAGINGCVVRVQSASQTAKFKIDGSTDSDVDNFKLYGSTFYGATTISTPPSGANVESLNCNFIACGEVLPRTSIMKYCNFVSATDIGVRVDSTSHQISSCSFISCPHGANFTTATSTHYAWNGNVHTGNTYDGRNATGGNVIIDVGAAAVFSTVDNIGGGSATTVNQNAVNVTLTVKTAAGAGIYQARVLVLAAAGGPMPYNATVTITNGGTTATVSHSGHGLATGDKAQITGASHWENNGIFPVTRINDNSYSYTMPSAPGSDPTGTIKATYAALEGLTDVNGQITMSRVFTSAQPITGRIRKSSGAPYFRTSEISDSISSSTGFATTVLLQADQ